MLARWAANAPLAFIDQHIQNLRQYRAIAIDVGDQDNLKVDTGKLHDVLTNYGITARFRDLPGTHTSHVAVRFQEHVMPFFSRTLSFEIGETLTRACIWTSRPSDGRRMNLDRRSFATSLTGVVRLACRWPESGCRGSPRRRCGGHRDRRRRLQRISCDRTTRRAAPTSSSSSSTTWAGRTSAPTVARFRRPISTRWPRAASASPSSTARHAARRRAPAC